jgi:hypothetical protein
MEKFAKQSNSQRYASFTFDVTIYRNYFINIVIRGEVAPVLN